MTYMISIMTPSRFKLWEKKIEAGRNPNRINFLKETRQAPLYKPLPRRDLLSRGRTGL